MRYGDKMNSLPHILHWLFPSGAAVAEWAAAIATGCLVGAGFIQLQAIRKGAEEQRARWKREDEIRAEENKPKAAFGLHRAKDEGQIEVWCTNLGTANFLVSDLRVTPVDGSDSRIIPLNEPVVSVGKKWSDVIAGDVFGFLFGTAEFRLRLEGSREEAETDAKVYWVNIVDGFCSKLQCGFSPTDGVHCPKCKRWIANYSADESASASVCRNEIHGIRMDFERTCPKHVTSNSRVSNVSASPLPS